MQPRLQRSRSGTPFVKVFIKFALVIFFIVFAFFFIEKIDFPSPEKEITEDVSDKIIKLK